MQLNFLTWGGYLVGEPFSEQKYRVIGYFSIGVVLLEIGYLYLLQTTTGDCYICLRSGIRMLICYLECTMIYFSFKISKLYKFEKSIKAIRYIFMTLIYIGMYVISINS